MSDSTLHLLPTDPNALPSEGAAALATEALQARFGDVSCRRSDTPVFVDAGQSFESAACPACGRELDLDWWARQMDAAQEQAFSDLSVRCPHCASTTSLNDLDYEMPQGFARFTLSIRNPDRDLDVAELREVEALLGTKLRVIWSHY